MRVALLFSEGSLTPHLFVPLQTGNPWPLHLEAVHRGRRPADLMVYTESRVRGQLLQGLSGLIVGRQSLRVALGWHCGA